MQCQRRHSYRGQVHMHLLYQYLQMRKKVPSMGQSEILHTEARGALTALRQSPSSKRHFFRHVSQSELLGSGSKHGLRLESKISQWTLVQSYVQQFRQEVSHNTGLFSSMVRMTTCSLYNRQELFIIASG
ncbi:hypothetical protein EJ03DRAFT_149636 [Teratosphaeria nubilosa]|uniref:Uncharacterized protein n=1 Tax=Teratosphaeria nubilosa TaxID=161662 RepID=A0A6G1LIZ6_9PEZI|nr:hypothetical protein EJ03DRAFT_149636 [Teratosphaeria nubilosa]